MNIRSARFFIYTTDFNQSFAFYSEVLGLRIVDHVLGGTVLAAGNLELQLLQERRDESEILDRRTGLIIFVDDVDAAYAKLTAHDVTILSEVSTTSDGERRFYLADPDGLPIGVYAKAAETMPTTEWLNETS